MRARQLKLAGVQVRLFRAVDDGVLCVEILTHDAKGADVLAPWGVPRLRVIVNDHSDVTTPNGGWQSEDPIPAGT